MLIDNRNLLRIKNRPLLDQLNQYTLVENKIVTETSKTGIPTLKLNVDGKFKYIHSKYDPEKEARRTINHSDIPNETKHVILFGVGLGYHIDLITEIYPSLTFTIFEPNIDILVNFLDTYSLDKVDQLNSVIHGKTQINNELTRLIDRYNNSIKIVALPSYAQIFKAELNQLYGRMIDILKNRKSKLVTNVAFQKRWTINAIKNFPSVLKTPNILKDVDHSSFEGKPAIIVAAGPSLNEEFDNLKYIKENGLAYIFSVGSAINSLIEQGIYPDAVCTYDPQAHNYQVIQKVKNKNIETIPLIFGSTVGFETLDSYKGPILHMLTNQDTVAQTLLKDEGAIDIVSDAPSIALVTFQLLTKLNIKAIYLVGQNLSFQNNRRYATGIEYGQDSVNENKMFSVKSVDNDIVWTDDGYNRMREQLESYIKATPNIEVYNTTKNGADIEGAPFIAMEQVIEDHFTTKNQVTDNWFHASPTYNGNNVKLSLNRLNKVKDSFTVLLNELENIVSQIHKMKNQSSTQLEKQFVKFDKKFKKLKNNKYYVTFLSPMLRVQLENLASNSSKIKNESDLVKKVELFFEAFDNLFMQLKSLENEIDSYFTELIELIELEQREVTK
ncbi:Uncharacterized conserved protein [Gracilibacillus orientalis]|uniref:Uncharacterized conserved protein n=1 Tax=Gracilibacillus orientalis TaxID=334253 RepID=A0A1I4P7F6_9BACI|nr:6-hydroxymethylpterin diphosphokinase MptE-like protein [Gracilibacillus orientalis]SFM23639.1 Uncharacterized conserved protein [Gracilibacillus orientalis]